MLKMFVEKLQIGFRRNVLTCISASNDVGLLSPNFGPSGSTSAVTEPGSQVK